MIAKEGVLGFQKLLACRNGYSIVQELAVRRAVSER